MSRSTRKPYITDQQYGCTKKAKRLASRRVRSTPEVGNGAAFKKVSSSWDICDFAFHAPKDKGAYRK